jgi:hypothetical protein
MPKLIEEIIINFNLATGNEENIYTKPRTPGKCLSKNKGEPVMLGEYQSLVGKII